MSTKSPRATVVEPEDSTGGARGLKHRELGAADYDVVLALQQGLRQDLIEGRGEDVLLTLEHRPPVLTGGRRSAASDLLVAPEELARRGVLLRNIERGGSWTWHGPGQLVAYPIVALSHWGIRVPAFVAGLESAMLELTDWALNKAGVDIEGSGWKLGRRCGFPGAWLQRPNGNFAKVGAVGVHFRRFVSIHGLAWNLDPDPWGFELIQPCGLTDEVTSVRRLCAELDGDSERLPSRLQAGQQLAATLPQWWLDRRPACRVFE